MKRVLSQQLLCLLESFISFAQMIKDLHQKLEQKYPNVFQPKNV